MTSDSDSKYIMIPIGGALRIKQHVENIKNTIHVFMGINLIPPFSPVTFLHGNMPKI